MIKSTAIGLVAGFFLMLLAVLFLRIWPNTKRGGAK